MPADAGDVVAIFKILGEADYMDLSPECTQRRFSVARGLASRGVTSDTARLLWEYAKHQGDNPPALFARWLSKPSIALQKVDEMLTKSQWVASVTRRLDEVEVSGDAAPIHDIRQHRRQA
jgi:hypothetical protein